MISALQVLNASTNTMLSEKMITKKVGHQNTGRFEHLCECAFVLSVLSWVIGFPQGM